MYVRSLVDTFLQWPRDTLFKVATPSVGFVGAVIRFQHRLANRFPNLVANRVATRL